VPRHIDPSRDLFFGTLALRIGLIEQAQFVAPSRLGSDLALCPLAMVFSVPDRFARNLNSYGHNQRTGQRST
jgi:hypothetical protein